MRGLIHNFYALAFRGQAVVGLGLVIWLISSVPDALMRDEYVGVPLLMGVIAGVISIASIWPFLTPNWVGRPTRLTQLLPLLLSHLALPLLYCFVAASAVVAAGISEPLARYVAISLSLGLIGASMVCWVLGTALCFIPRRRRNRSLTAEVVELPPAAPPAKIREEQQSRMRAS